MERQVHQSLNLLSGLRTSLLEPLIASSLALDVSLFLPFLPLLTDLFKSLQYLVTGGGSLFSSILITHSQFLSTMSDLHGILTLCQRRTQESKLSLSSPYSKLKFLVISLNYLIMESLFLEPLGLPSPSTPFKNADSKKNLNNSISSPSSSPSFLMSTSMKLFDYIHDFVDAISLSNLPPHSLIYPPTPSLPMYLKTASFFQDMDIEFDLMRVMTSLKARLPDPEESRLEVCLHSLNHWIQPDSLNSIRSARQFQKIRSNKVSSCPGQVDPHSNLIPSSNSSSSSLESNSNSNSDSTLGQQSLELDIQQKSLTTGLQDLFPDLGEGYLERILRFYDWNGERSTMALLEDTLDISLKDLNRLEPSLSSELTLKETSLPGQSEPLLPHSLLPQNIPTALLPLSNRANVFDGDSFDVFSRGTLTDLSRVHVGKKSKVEARDFHDRSFVKDPVTRNKIRAGAIWEDYDDDYDDTYDSNDIQYQGKIPLSLDPEEEIEENDGLGKEEFLNSLSPLNMKSDSQVSKEKTEFHTKKEFTSLPGESKLIQVYQSNPILLDRSSRKSSARQILKSESGLTDEQIEGWKTMLEKNVTYCFPLFKGQDVVVEGWNFLPPTVPLMTFPLLTILIFDFLIFGWPEFFSLKRIVYSNKVNFRVIPEQVSQVTDGRPKRREKISKLGTGAQTTRRKMKIRTRRRKEEGMGKVRSTNEEGVDYHLLVQSTIWVKETEGGEEGVDGVDGVEVEVEDPERMLI